MLIVMSIPHPRLRSFSLEPSLKTPAALAARVGVVHYISTLLSIAVGLPESMFIFPAGCGPRN